MNLAALRFAHGDKFYKQTWFEGEAFMLREPAPLILPPRDFVATQNATLAKFLPYTATLAQLWLDFPELDLWTKCVWTADTDSKGQQVYVCVNDGKFEIHRHLHLTDRWGVARW
jgi:hypothetical protein